MNRLSPALVVPFFVCILVGNVAGHFAAVAEAEAEPAKQRAAATADVAGHVANVRGAGAMASTTFLAEVTVALLV